MYNPIASINQKVFDSFSTKNAEQPKALPTGMRGFMASAKEGHQQGPFDMGYYIRSAIAGGLCCSITHGALCPVDVVKTRIQLEPLRYNQGMVSAFRTVVAEEGVMALSTGLGATFVGYFVQGWFKFGGVELFKINIAEAVGERKAWDNRTSIYLAAAACAEFIADLFLCPLEAARIRGVSDPNYANGLVGTASRIFKEEGVRGFYAGLTPILFKQIPYTMAKFAVQGWAAEKIYTVTKTAPETSDNSWKTTVALSSGVVAGVSAAIISHPADTLLSMVNKTGAGGDGTVAQRLIVLAKQAGFKKLALVGLGPRCVMIGTLTAGQFGIFDNVMAMTGAKKFHFHNPDE